MTLPAAATVTIRDGKGATIAADVPIRADPDADAFELDAETARALAVGTIYVAYFADGAQPRAFTRREAGRCRFYPRLVGRQVPGFDLGGLTLGVTKSQVILDAIAHNAGLMDPVLLADVQGGTIPRAVVCEEGTRIQFEVTGAWPAAAKGVRWEVRTADAAIANGYAAPRPAAADDAASDAPDDGLLVVIDRYMSTDQSIMVRSLSDVQIGSADLGTLAPMTVTFRVFALSDFEVASERAAGLPLVSFAVRGAGPAASDAVKGAVVMGPDAGDPIVAGTLRTLSGDPAPIATAAVYFFVTPSHAIADALFGTH